LAQLLISTHDLSEFIYQKVIPSKAYGFLQRNNIRVPLKDLEESLYCEAGRVRPEVAQLMIDSEE